MMVIGNQLGLWESLRNVLILAQNQDWSNSNYTLVYGLDTSYMENTSARWLPVGQVIPEMLTPVLFSSSWVWVAFPSSALCNLQAPPSWGSLPWLPYCLKVKNATCQAPASTWIVTPRPILVSFGDLGSWRSSSGHKMSWAPPGLGSGWVWVCVCVCVCVHDVHKYSCCEFHWHAAAQCGDGCGLWWRETTKPKVWAREGEGVSGWVLTLCRGGWEAPLGSPRLQGWWLDPWEQSWAEKRW